MMRSLITLLLLTALCLAMSFAGGNLTSLGASGVNASFDPAKMIPSAGTPGAAVDRKLDPLIAYVERKVEAAQRGSSPSAIQELLSPTSVVAVDLVPGMGIVMPLLIRSDDPSSTRASIEARGGKVTTTAGDILVAYVPLQNVRAVALRTDVVSVAACSRRERMLNVSHVEVKADKVHSGLNLPRAYKGGSVIAGILDTGIDWHHDDFKTSSTSSRIQYLWDVSGSTNPPGEFGYGQEYSKAQIDAGTCNERDGNGGDGHGTHVSGTVAGNARAQAGYTGIAPEADIIFVKGIRDTDSQGGFRDDDVVNGCSYIFTRAQSLGKPAAINLSIGGHYGPHDGTSNYEQALSNLTGSGKIIVAAAGNEAGSPRHLRYTTGGSDVDSARQTFWVIPAGSSLGLVDMWYDTGNISVGLAAYDGGLNLLGYTNPVAPGNKIENLPFTVGLTTVGYVTVDATATDDPNNHAKRVIFVVDSNGGAVNISQVYWAVYTFGSGTFDAWVVTGGNFTVDSNPTLGIMPGDNVRCIGMPSTSLQLLSVGSYVTKNQWVDIDGVTRTQPGNPTIGNISSFSNHGPTRDGRIKPDIAAPGEAIVSALSSFLDIGVGVQRTDILQGGKYQKMQGTSMASPHVTGAVALMLDARPTLTPDSVRAILQQTARVDGTTGTTPNNIWGAGRLDVYEAVKRAAGGGGGEQTLTLRNFTPSSSQHIYILDHTLPIDSGFVFGPNVYDDMAKATCLSLPEGTSSGQLTNVNVWFGYKRSGLTTQNYNLRVYNGTPTSGPVASPLYSQQFNMTDIQADDNFSTNESPTSHTLASPVTVGSSFFVSVDFGLYSPSDRGTTGIVSSTLTGSRVAEEWEWWNDGTWHNVSDAWNGGTDGWQMWIEATVTTGTTDVRPARESVPGELTLFQNYPNPFNPTTKMSFVIGHSSFVSLRVFDVLGREVATLVSDRLQAGEYERTWDARNMPSGIYFYELEATSIAQPAQTARQVMKMTLLK